MIFDVDGMEGRGRCGRCSLWPPIKFKGRWIDYCLPCYVEWLGQLADSEK